MRLNTSRATLLGAWNVGDIVAVTEKEAAALEASGAASRLEELEKATTSPPLERPERKRGRPRRQE